MDLVIFDLDGTLTQTDTLDDRVYRQAIKEALDLTCPDNWEGFSHQTATGLLAELMVKEKEKDLTPKDHDKTRDHFLDLMMDALMDMDVDQLATDGGQDLVTNLLDSDQHMVAISTGGWGPAACFKLSSAGYDIADMVMATGDDDFDRMEILMLARERAEERLPEGQSFDQIIYVGDNQWDKLAAEGLGWQFIGVGDLVQDAQISLDSLAGAEKHIFKD